MSQIHGAHSKHALLCAFALAQSFLLHLTDARACAACRNPTMPVSNVGGAPLESRQLRLGLTVTGTTVRIVHEAGCQDLGDCEKVPIQPLHLHDQRITPFEARLRAEYSLTTTWGFEVQLPARTVVARIDYTTPEGDPYEPLDEGVHHRNEVLVGLGDPWLLGRAQFELGNVQGAVRAGVTLPLGHTEENPFALGDRGEAHQHIQMGTGTIDPVLGLDLQRAWRRHFVRGYALGLLALYENRHGFRAPLRLQSGAFWGIFFKKNTAAEAGLEVLHESPERWDGRVEQDASQGRTELLVSPSLTHTIQRTTLLASARFPIVRVIRATEDEALVYQSPVTLSLGVAYLF